MADILPIRRKTLSNQSINHNVIMIFHYCMMIFHCGLVLQRSPRMREYGVRSWFVCLFGSFSSHSKILHSFGDVPIAGEGLLILTYARHLLPLSSEGSVACHTYCDVGHLFYTGHLRGPMTLIPNAERLAVELSLPVLTN